MEEIPPKKQQLGKVVEKYWKNKMNKKKGQFVVYTKEGKRFVVPLCYLDHPIFKVLLEMAEEEYGLTVHGPLIVPCEKELMEYILSLLKKKTPSDVEKALLSVTTCKATGGPGASLSNSTTTATPSFSPMMAAAAASSSGQNHLPHQTAMLSMSCS